MQDRMAWGSVVRRVARIAGVLVAALLLFAPSVAWCGTYYVDGACPTSGTGASLTCGTNGPFKTIMEAIEAAAKHDGLNPPRSPVTITIRGAHGTFNGDYDEYLGLWGVGGTATPDAKAHYYALNCTPTMPCVIQGCPASVCGSDETPNVSGLVHRRDWTQTAPGSGIWYRVMEPRTTYTAGEWYAMTDDYDPGILVRGPTDDSTRQIMQYSLTANAPASGRWFYEASTHRVYVNPGGGANPNTDSTASIWVPDQAVMLALSDYSNDPCPDEQGNAANCPPTDYLTFRRITFSGGRRFDVIMDGNASTPFTNLTFDTVAVRYSSMIGIIGSQFSNLSFNNLTVENIGRGLSVVRNAFGIRLFHVNGGTMTDVSSSHIGSAGGNNADPNYGGCSSGGSQGVWLSAPWRSAAGNPNCSNGVGFDLKQSNKVLLSNYRSDDTALYGLQIDETTNSEVSGCQITRSASAIQHIEYTPDASGGATSLKNNLIHNCRIDDCGWNDKGCINLKTTDDTLAPGEFTVRVYDNFISHAAFAGIYISQSYSSGGSTAKADYIWNNSIWGARSLLGYGPQDDASHNTSANTAPAGLVIDTGQIDASYHVNTLSTFEFRNNIVAGMPVGGVIVPAASLNSSGVNINNNLYYGDGSPLLNWKGTLYTAVGQSSSACTGPGFECNGVSGTPLFVDTAASLPDLHIQQSSAAKDAGATLPAFDRDIDNQSRPVGSAWDIGADEVAASAGSALPAPTLLQVIPVPSP